MSRYTTQALANAAASALKSQLGGSVKVDVAESAAEDGTVIWKVTAIGPSHNTVHGTLT